LSGQLVRGAAADAQHAGGLLDGQHLGQFIERRPSGRNAKLATLDHGLKLRPCH
jgi:hypothetical protein